ncbi:hypothetical protein ACSTIQ_00090, partial [Vibrio parahaemolyticus]
GPWDRRLPQILGPLDAVGEVSRAACEDLGLKGPPLVGPGTGDNMAAALGIARGPGDVAVSLGTSGTVFATHPEPTA